MLKKRDTAESYGLYDLMQHPDVFPYVRQKANSSIEYCLLTRKTLEEEMEGKTISRTIVDEWERPIGTISLFDIQDHAGFLATWLGKLYHGKGYNQKAKDAFFQELFFEQGIRSVFMKIRKTNIRSLQAAKKLPYAIEANGTRKALYEEINEKDEIYDLFEISKDQYVMYLLRKEKCLENRCSKKVAN